MLGNEREGCDKGCGRRKDVPSLQDGPAINLCLLVDVRLARMPTNGFNLVNSLLKFNQELIVVK